MHSAHPTDPCVPIHAATQIVNHDYRLVFVMSNFSSDSWFIWWLTGINKRLSPRHRAHLRAISILHPSVTVRLLCAGVSTWYGRALWNMLHYADRIDQLILDGVLTRQQIADLIPRSVVTYEAALLEEAEEARRQAVMIGAPLLAAETDIDGNNADRRRDTVR